MKILHITYRVSQHLIPLWIEYKRIFPEDDIVYYSDIGRLNDKYDYSGYVNLRVVYGNNYNDNDLLLLMNTSDIIFWTPFMSGNGKNIAHLLYTNNFKKYILTENLNKTDNMSFIFKLKRLYAYFLIEKNNKEVLFKIDNYHKNDIYLAQSSNLIQDFFFLRLKRPIINFGYFTYYDYSNKSFVERANVASITSYSFCKHNEYTYAAYKEAKKYNSSLVLNIFGECKKIEGDKSVVYHGYLSKEKLMMKLKSIEIYIFGSAKGDGFGVSLLEAMSNGCIIFANYYGGATKWVVEDKVNGFVFKNRRQLIKKIKYYYSLSLVEKEQISKNAVDTIKNIWDPMEAAKRLHDYLHFGIIHKRGPMSKGNRHFSDYKVIHN